MCSESDRLTSGNTLTPCDVGALSVRVGHARRATRQSVAPLSPQNLRVHTLTSCTLQGTSRFAFSGCASGVGVGAGTSASTLGRCASVITKSTNVALGRRASDAGLRNTVVMAISCAYPLVCVPMWAGLAGAGVSLDLKPDYHGKNLLGRA